jgi:hypothetical protein
MMRLTEINTIEKRAFFEFTISIPPFVELKGSRIPEALGCSVGIYC